MLGHGAKEVYIGKVSAFIFSITVSNEKLEDIQHS